MEFVLIGVVIGVIAGAAALAGRAPSAPDVPPGIRLQDYLWSQYRREVQLRNGHLRKW